MDINLIRLRTVLNDKEDEIIGNIALLLSENTKEQYSGYDFTGIAKLCVTALRNVAK